jgi:hypothetical protein
VRWKRWWQPIYCNLQYISSTQQYIYLTSI